MNNEQYIGIMSGTSLDGVDVVLCEIDGTSCTLLESLEYPFPSELKAELLWMMSSDNNTLEEVGRADHSLGILFAEAISALLVPRKIKTKSIKAIGLHGQTLWHDPSGKYPFTMQLGDANILAAKTGIEVVADFRRKDVALGGQGAPFAPAFHEFIFANIEKPTAVVNIGGMANITVLDENLIGYDTGCGNVLMDLWIAKHKNLPYDKVGAWAKSGTVDKALLELMLYDSYFMESYPKSTGREKFNLEWIELYIKKYNFKALQEKDVQRTLLELTAVSITREINHFHRKQVLLCGGGAKNTFLLERIQALLPSVEVSIAPNADYIEAMAFAWLAYKRIHKEKVNLKDVTGARKNTILGALYA